MARNEIASQNEQSFIAVDSLPNVNDSLSFVQMVLGHRLSLRNQRLLDIEQLAIDIVADFFVRFEIVRTTQTELDPKGFLRFLTIQRMLDALRQEGRLKRTIPDRYERGRLGIAEVPASKACGRSTLDVDNQDFIEWFESTLPIEQQRIVHLCRTGLTNAEISFKLGLSIRQVQRKLNEVKNRLEAEIALVDRTTERQNDRTTEQQNNRTTEQQNNRTTEQQNDRTTVSWKVRFTNFG
jgi:DNA-directed RNA polymerase specialized sigma24 family protein